MTTSTPLPAGDAPPPRASCQALPSRTWVGGGTSYTLRSLTDESEIDEWTHFCAQAFADKSTGRPPDAAHFARHYWNDPLRDVTLIRVAEQSDTGVMVASCRVFRRHIYLPNCEGGVVSAGGIGEVGTLPAHRRRGLSKALLQDAIDIMRQQQQPCIAVSLLHAAPSFFPVYESVGYDCTTTPWTVVPFRPPLLVALRGNGGGDDTRKTKPLVRLASFPNDAPALCDLYHRVSAQSAGCVVRSEAYWTEYLGREWKESLWVLEDNSRHLDGTDANGSEDDDDDDNAQNVSLPPPQSHRSLRGWLCVRRRDRTFDGTNIPRLQVCDFAYRDAADAATILATLLNHACQCQEGLLPSSFRDPDAGAVMGSLELALPTAAAEVVRSSDTDECVDDTIGWLNWSNAVPEVDRGWMYRPVDGGNDSSDVAKAAMAVLRSRPLLFWPADSF